MQGTNYSSIVLFGLMSLSGATCHELVKQKGSSSKYKVSSVSKFSGITPEKVCKFNAFPTDATEIYNNSFSDLYQENLDIGDKRKIDTNLSNSSSGYYKESIDSLSIEDNPVEDTSKIQDLGNVYVSDKGEESTPEVNNNTVVELSKIKGISNINFLDDEQNPTLPIQESPVFELSKIQDSIRVDKCEDRTEDHIEQFIKEINKIKTDISNLLLQNSKSKDKSYYLWNFLEFVKRDKEHSSHFLEYIDKFSVDIDNILCQVDNSNKQIECLRHKSQDLNERNLGIKDQINNFSVDIKNLYKYIDQISKNTHNTKNQIQDFLKKQIDIKKFKQQSSQIGYRMQNMNSTSIPCM